jgi:hypothetical protein
VHQVLALLLQLAAVLAVTATAVEQVKMVGRVVVLAIIQTRQAQAQQTKDLAAV